MENKFLCCKGFISLYSAPFIIHEMNLYAFACALPKRKLEHTHRSIDHIWKAFLLTLYYILIELGKKLNFISNIILAYTTAKSEHSAKKPGVFALVN